jgi:hypothetical protein
MIDPDYMESFLNNGWIERIDPDEMGERYLEDTYRLKPGAPEDIKKEWEELCGLFRLYG